MLYRTIHTLIIIAVVAMTISCIGNTGYPEQLVQAENAMMTGDYIKLDSILTNYDEEESLPKPTGMYLLLLRLGQKYVADDLTIEDFSDVDSLHRYYHSKFTPKEYALTSLFLCDIYKEAGDAPSALECLNKARKASEGISSATLQIWLNEQQGDILLSQRMLDECIPYYRQCYQTACDNKDTLRMAYAAFRMGRVCTICNDIDSTLW